MEWLHLSGHLLLLSTWAENKDVGPKVPTSSRETPNPTPNNGTWPHLSFGLGSNRHKDGENNHLTHKTFWCPHPPALS